MKNKSPLKRLVLVDANRLLGLFNAEVVRKSELELLRKRCGEISANQNRRQPLPALAEQKLRADHPRLLDLHRRYRKVALPVLDNSKWSRTLVQIDIDLRHFRADNAFVFQYRDFNNECHLLPDNW